MVITTAKFHSTKPELRFWASSNPANGASKIRDGEDLWQMALAGNNSKRLSLLSHTTKTIYHHHHHHHHHQGQEDLKQTEDHWYREEKGEALKWIPFHSFVICFSKTIKLNISVLKPLKMGTRYAVNYYFFQQNIVVNSVKGLKDYLRYKSFFFS